MIALGEQHYDRMLEPMSLQAEEQIKSVCLNIKLKNQLCRNYLQTGYCKYHDKCQFAHGIQQLRQHHSANNKYKTKKCMSYFQRGFCSYGERCNFRHHELADIECQISWARGKRLYREVFSFAKGTTSLL